MADFTARQGLNSWVRMLHELYGNTQNYNKTPFELHAHLTEVVGLAGKHLTKRVDLIAAERFTAKAFAWASALGVRMGSSGNNLEELLLQKFPAACPYCLSAPCACWTGQKPTLDENRLRDAYFQAAPAAGRSPNDFQLMFKRIYEGSWGAGATSIPQILNRLLEELAELSEALRFSHLYPKNFENELADFLAWWFALVSTMHSAAPGASPILAEDLLWKEYPGVCLDCCMCPCFCRPGPVRELVSKPAPGQPDRLDRLTLVFNQAAYLEDTAGFCSGRLPMATPFSVVRVDLDRFKSVNDTHGHAAGDQAIRSLAATLRSKARERDRIYRAGGDEFVVMCPDFSKEEGAGYMRRVSAELHQRPVRWVSDSGHAIEFGISVSVGVAECFERQLLQAALEAADGAAYQSKEGGRDRITVAY